MRSPRILIVSLFALAGGLVRAPQASAAEIRLTDPDYGAINANGLDQPRLYFLLSDPTQNDAIITRENPSSGETEPVLLTAFIDTGASGFALSHLHISGDLDQPSIGLSHDQPGDFLGPFTEIGIGGPEVGDVSRPLGVWVRNGAIGVSEEILVSEFTDFGDFSLWTRRETGAAEVVDFMGFPIVSPLNLVGMPVIRQRRLLLDVTPMNNLNALGLPDPLETALLAPGAPEPATQATIPLLLRDFIGDTLPPGEVAPSHYANPLVPGLTLHGAESSATGEWLLDTGAGASFASFAIARAAGLVPAHYATLAEFMADYTGPTVEIGGIGASQSVPRLTAPRITVATREGATLVWENVGLLIADVAGLDGIFGMNLLVPSITLDPADPLGSLSEISPSTIRTVVIDTTDAADPVMRLGTSAADGTVFAWLGEEFSAAERSLPDVGALAADADADGFSNLLEYALGLDPRFADPASAAVPLASTPMVAGQPHFALTYTRLAGGRPDVDYAVEISHDLVAWRRDTGEVISHATETIGGIETLTLRTAAPLAPGGRVFLRLRVSFAN